MTCLLELEMVSFELPPSRLKTELLVVVMALAGALMDLWTFSALGPSPISANVIGFGGPRRDVTFFCSKRDSLGPDLKRDSLETDFVCGRELFKGTGEGKFPFGLGFLLTTGFLPDVKGTTVLVDWDEGFVFASVSTLWKTLAVAI